MANENGTLAKLTALRQAFLAGVDEARTKFVARLKTLREEYLAQVVDATLADPRLVGVEKALGDWPSQPATPVASPASSALVQGMVPIDQEPGGSHRLNIGWLDLIGQFYAGFVQSSGVNSPAHCA